MGYSDPALDPKAAAAFYVKQLGFKISGEDHNMVSLHGKRINLFIEEGPALGPILEVTLRTLKKQRGSLWPAGANCERRAGIFRAAT